MKFRKKPIVIEAAPVAELLALAAHRWTGLPDWIKSAYENGDVQFLANAVTIRTLEGLMTGNREDWIIKGVRGELYPCKPDIFEATYESVEE